MSKIDTAICTQIGILCHDIEATAKAWSEFLGQPYTLQETADYEISKAQYRGTPTEAKCKQAFFQLGDQVQLELIQPDEKPSVWREDLDKHGEGIHHIAFFVKGSDGYVQKLKEFDCTMQGYWETGRYTYLDARDSLKVVIELLENLK